MEVKCLEVRDEGTCFPVICLRPVPENEAQRYWLKHDGYRGDDTERCIIMIDVQCRGVAYDPYAWNLKQGRTRHFAHQHITNNWASLKDGDVIDVEYLLGERPTPKVSERFKVPV